MKSIVGEFTKAVTKTVNQFFPALVASELSKLEKTIKVPSARSTSSALTDEDKQKRLAQIIKLRKQGLSQSQIGDKLGLKQPTISQLLKHLGSVSVSSKSKSKAPIKTKPNGVSTSKPLHAALVKHGSRTLAAKALGLARQTFSDRLAKE